MAIDGRTGFYALIGSPVGHSGSPAMYNYSFQKTGINDIYLAFDVQLSQTEEAVRALKALGCKGFNVTMPCKTRIAELADELSDAAALIGASNTVVVKNQKLYGHNTDGIGFVRNLWENGVEVKDKVLTVMGREAQLRRFRFNPRWRVQRKSIFLTVEMSFMSMQKAQQKRLKDVFREWRCVYIRWRTARNCMRKSVRAIFL